MRSLIFGCGYLGRRVASMLVAAGDEVLAVTRSPDKATQLAAIGCRPVVADVNNPPSLAALPEADRVLFAVGYDREEGRSIGEVYEGGVRAVLAALSPSVERFVYVSSTGVYGQTGDVWVDEDSPCRPTRAGGVACLAAEQAIAQYPLGRRAVILRMAGVYGPGRIPYLDLLKSGQPIPAPRSGYLNLIHVDDAAAIAVAALDARLLPPLSQGKREGGPRIYCVSDGWPVVREAYFAQVSQRLAAPPPRFQVTAATPAADRATSSKRVSNRRMMAELPIRLAYGSYREGLEAILSAASPLPENGSLP